MTNNLNMNQIPANDQGLLFRQSWFQRALAARTLPQIVWRLFVIASLALAAVPVQAQTNSSGEFDYLAFYKKMISNPPDIEHFKATTRTIRHRLPANLLSKIGSNNLEVLQTFEGAIGKEGFYLRNDTLVPWHIEGRYGTNFYIVSPTGLSLPATSNDSMKPKEKDQVSISSEASRTVADHFVRMGVGTLRPETVVWTHNEFEALTEQGVSMYGSIQLSNHLPWKLSLFWHRGEAPVRQVLYEYPQPPTGLGGFPRLMTHLALFKDWSGLQPIKENELVTVTIASQDLDSDFFRPAQFIGSEVHYTNIYSSSGLKTVIDAKGIHSAGIRNVQEDPAMARWRSLAVFACFAAATVFPLAIHYRRRASIKQ